MSKDFQIAFPCPHLVMEEVTTLGSDRRSLVPKGPVASANVVRVLVNDEVYIPPGGLFAQAQLEGSTSGPFRIEACDRTFTVQGSTETATFELPVGNRVEPLAILRMLLNGLTDVVPEIVRGHLVLTDAGTAGLGSSLLVSGSGAASIGFAAQRGSRGRQVYPGWGLASAPATVTGRYPQFVSPVKQNPVFKLTYVTEGRYCPRCSGTYIENDYRFDIQGDAVLIQNENLLYQAALKVLLTQIRSNPYHPDYGSAILSRIGTKAIGAVTSIITGDVQAALSNMQAQQAYQSKFQTVSAKEKLYAVTSVRVTQSPTDQTAFEVDVVVRNASGDPIAISIVFSVPGVGALTGTNGLSLGLETTGLSSTQSNRLLR
jgi:hypothetical protein